MKKEPKSLDEIWEGDLLKRRQEAEFLEDFLQKVSIERPILGDRGSLVVNLKAPWGQGKTFFLAKFAEQLRANGHKVAQLNAWRADPEIDPLVALMGAIEKVIEPELNNAKGQVSKAFEIAKQAGGEIAKSSFKSIVLALFKRGLGEGVDDLADIASDAFLERGVTGSDLVKDALENASAGAADAAEKLDLQVHKSSRFAKELRQVGKHQAAVEKFSDSIARIAAAYAKKSSNARPFYVFVDELDRCRPTFAIEVLERINHLFDTRGVVFIIGTHSDELENSINAVYGSKFNSSGYLNRFFDLTYNLATPALSDWIDHLLQAYSIELSRYLVPPENTHKDVLINLGRAAGLSLRDHTQVFFLLSAVQTSWQHQAKLDLVSIYAYAIAIHLKLGGLPGIPKSLNYAAPSSGSGALHSARIQYLRAGRRDSVSLSDYLQEMYSAGSSTVQTAMEETHTTNRTSFHEHRRNLLISQVEGRPPKLLKEETPLWNQYVNVLHTARRVSLPDAEPS